MKKTKIFALLTGVVLAVTAGAALGGAKKAEPAKAATETTVYYSIPDSVVGTYTVKLNVNFRGDGDDWNQYNMTKTDKTLLSNPIYSCTYTDAYDGVGNMQFQLYDGSEWKSQEEIISSWTSASSYNGKLKVYNDSSWHNYSEDKTLGPDNTYYLYDPRGFLESGDGYCYAYYDGFHHNADFPGEEMTDVSEKVYSINVSSTYSTLIFGDGSNGYGNIQTTSINNANEHAGEYFVITHKNAEGRLQGEWWESTTSPYCLNLNGDHVMNLNLAQEPTVCEYGCQNIALLKGTDLRIYAGEQILNLSSISIRNGANAFEHGAMPCVHNDALGGVYIMKTASKWALWVDGYEDQYSYTVGEGTTNYIYKSVAPEGYKARYAETLNVSKDDTISFKRENTVLLASDLTIKEGANLYKDNGQIKVHNDASTVILELLIKNDDTYEVNLGGFESVRVLNIVHSDMTINTVNIIEHTSTEFKTENPVSVVAGDVLVFYIDGVIQTINPKPIGNNNCYSDSGRATILFDMTATIYVDYAAGTVFCGGLPYGEFGLVVNQQFVRMTHNETPADPSFTEWYKEGYTFAENDVIRFVDLTGTNKTPVVFDIPTINSFSTEGFEVIDDSYIKCVAEGGKTTNIYVKFKSGVDEVYFGDMEEDLAQAIDFAKVFNESIGGICKADGTTTTTSLQSNWNTLNSDFSALLDNAKLRLKNASNSSGSDDLKEFAAKYDYVYGKYGESLELVNFASRSVTPIGSSKLGISASNNLNNSTWIIAVIAVTSMSLLAGIVFIQRRKSIK